jgi:hypothetical protein
MGVLSMLEQHPGRILRIGQLVPKDLRRGLRHVYEDGNIDFTSQFADGRPGR